MKGLKVFSHTMSLACIAHCIITPLLMLFSPFLGHYLNATFIEIPLLVFSIFCGIFIIYSGYCTHKKQHAIYLFSLGAILWCLHTGIEHFSTFGGEIYLLIGTGLVLASYQLNHRHIKCCGECKHYH